METTFFRFSILLLTLIVAFTGTDVSAADYTVRHYNERDGLPNRQVYDIKADSLGFVWTFSNSGLARFDGNEFKNYGLKGLNLSPDFAPYFSKLKTGEDGCLVLSVSSGQIFAYSNEKDRFDKIFDFADFGTAGRLNNFVISGDTTIFATNDGVWLKDASDFRRVGLPGVAVNDIAEVGDGLWIAATLTGLYCLSPGAGQWLSFSVEGTKDINFNCVNNCDGKVFAGSFSEGLWICPLDGRRAYRSDIPIPAMPFTTMASCDGLLYLGVDGAGVYAINPETNRIVHHFLYSPEGDMLSANTISGISLGRGGLWVSTSSHGINLITGKQPTVVKTAYDKSNSNSLPSDCVNVVFQDSDGELWYGTDAGVSLRRKNGEWNHFLSRQRGADTNILTIAQANDGNIYAGGYGSGAWKIDKHTGKAERLPSRKGDSGLDTDYVYAIFCDSTDIWFGGIQGYITRYNTTDETYHYYPSECVCRFVKTADGTIYVAGCGGIGTYYSGREVKWERKAGGVDVLSSRDAAYDPTRNEMWYAAENQGLICHNLNTDKATLLPLGNADELTNVQGVLVDRNFRVWFYTEQDLFVVDPENGQVTCATALLDIEDVSFIPRSAIIDSDGNIVIGTTDGAMTITTDLNTAPDVRPEIIFSSLSVGGHIRETGSDEMPVSLDRLSKLKLKNDENTFIIHFSAISYGNNRLLTFRWRLKGFDKDWQTASSNNLVFRNLPFGNYTLEIEVSNTLTGDVLSSRSLDIQILPPLWLSWWAILLYIIIGVSATFMVIKFLRKREHEKNITDKIHSFLNIVHDLRTPVTLIKAPLSEIETCRELPEETLKNARLAMSNVDKLLAMIGRLLDLRHESQHSDCLNLSDTDLREFLDMKAQEWKIAAINKGLTLTVEVPENMSPVLMDCNKVSHMLDNLLSNAIKYTFSGGVKMSARSDRKHWYIEISDTGIGIPRSDMQRMFSKEFRGENAVSTDEIGSGLGLLIVHRLSKLHKGTVKVFSKENEGSTFLLSFPLTYKQPYRLISDSQDKEQFPADEKDENPISDKETIMLIDDEKDILDYLAGALSGTYRTVCFSDASEALKQVADINPDIVVCDVRLKGMSGFEFCQKIKSSVETSHIPVVMLSGLSERENIILGLESGASDYILKPFDISVLRLRLRNLLKMRQRLQTSMLEGTDDGNESGMTVSALDTGFMDRVRTEIDAHISESGYTSADLCRVLGLSRTSVYNKIKALTGEAINEYIRSRRLVKAKELLAQGEHSVSEVAYLVGFSDPKYFSYTFKRFFGVSPSKI